MLKNPGVAEGESATYADIIEEFLNSAIFPPFLPPNDRLRQADSLFLPACVRVVVLLGGCLTVKN